MQVESLDGTEWDVVIAGTGLHQSLLALALSQSGKKVLHVDKNAYYGGCEAAFSLQEAEEWVNDNTQIYHRLSHIHAASSTEGHGPKLSFPRAYSLALAPQLIYTQAKLIQNLVTSKAFRQLEFQAMGSWWMYSGVQDDATSKFTRIPTNREDIAFSDASVDIRSKRSIMKVLRFMIDFEEKNEIWEPFRDMPLSRFLKDYFKLTQPIIDLFSALALSPHSVDATTTEFALPRIARHLRSIGRLGPGFSSIIPKWGGLSEVAQVGCRAGAVGGAVYVLHNSVSKVEHSPVQLKVRLSSGDNVKTKFLVGSKLDLPGPSEESLAPTASRGVYVIGSKLLHLFPKLTEGAPLAAGAVVIFPAGSLTIDGAISQEVVHLIVHTSDTGECPKDQCIVYASTTRIDSAASQLLDNAISCLLQDSSSDQPAATVLWLMHYQLNGPTKSTEQQTPQDSLESSKITLFPATLSSDLVFDDAVLERVKAAWRTVLELDPDGADDSGFLVFADREGQPEADDDDNDDVADY